MLRRPERSSFAAGAFVFPGGAVDDADGTGDDAYAVAGVREVLEEVGILIGGTAAGSDAGGPRGAHPGRAVASCLREAASARCSPNTSW